MSNVNVFEWLMCKRNFDSYYSKVWTVQLCEGNNRRWIMTFWLKQWTRKCIVEVQIIIWVSAICRRLHVIGIEIAQLRKHLKKILCNTNDPPFYKSFVISMNSSNRCLETARANRIRLFNYWNEICNYLKGNYTAIIVNLR